MKVNIAQAKEMLIALIRSNLVALIEGSPGVGKSAIVKQIAKEYGLKVIDLRLAQCDPTDLIGLPSINRDTNKACYMPLSTFPLEGDPIPEGYNGWLLFLDEFKSADRSVQKAAYKLLLDRQIGDYNLHKNVAIVAAGNLDTDNAFVEEMSTANQSRVIPMQLVIDSEQWIEWAIKNNFDHHITSFIKHFPHKLYTFKPDHTENTYACPRTWEFTDRLIKQVGLDSNILTPLLAGTVSEGIAREFVAFLRFYKDLPEMGQIKASPETVPVPEDPSTLYALTGSIAHYATENNIEVLMKYVSRFPVEFQVVCIKELGYRSKKLQGHPAIIKWMAQNATELF
jgi:hypothetical protein